MATLKNFENMCHYWHKQGALFYMKQCEHSDIMGIVYCPYNNNKREKDSAEKNPNWLGVLFDSESENLHYISPTIIENLLPENTYWKVLEKVIAWQMLPFLNAYNNSNGNAYLAENAIIFRHLQESAEIKNFNAPHNVQFIKGAENILAAISGLRKLESAQEMVSILRDKL